MPTTRPASHQVGAQIGGAVPFLEPLSQSVAERRAQIDERVEVALLHRP
jgi:hypothetical protein